MEAPLNNTEFVLCLALRCYALPIRFSFATVDVQTRRPLRLAYKCNAASCGRTIGNDQDYIDHLFECVAGTEHVNTSTRHNWLKYAISGVISHHGIPCTIEPRMYSPHYTQRNDSAHIDRRPDLLCRTVNPVVTDFGIVMQSKGGRVGDAASAYAHDKKKLHDAACKSIGHRYYSFIVETHGHVDKDAKDFIEQVVREAPAVDQRAFAFELNYVTSVVLAKTRAMMIVSDQASRNFVKMQEM
jgi:hypothetical protein